jgi:hypothetical protein
MDTSRFVTRRHFLKCSGSLAALAMANTSVSFGDAGAQTSSRRDQALIAITMDLEMARNFPKWEDTHWDYEKGNLNEEAKAFAVEAARRVKARGGLMHFFAVGQVFEQENVDWLKKIRDTGHKIGNHTYDHIYVLARKPEELQYKFQRAPWLLRNKPIPEAIRDNIQLCADAMQSRLGIKPCGFRTPGGFATGLNGRPDIQKLLLDLGYKWVSCKYPAHPYGTPGANPTAEVLRGILAAQTTSQPFKYSSGLIDLPMSPISDIGAYRNSRWTLPDFEKAVSLALDWAIENGAVFDFLCHPSVEYPNDPEFRIIDLILSKVERAGSKARIADLEEISLLSFPLTR